MKRLCLISILFSGCFSPDLGTMPFLCNDGTPPCPTGYVCITHQARKVCVLEGTTFDIGLSDITGTIDGKIEAGPHPDLTIPPDGTTTSGTIRISEFMADPGATYDDNGEYLELFNLSNVPIDINGWTLKDNGSDSHTINNGAPLYVPAKGFIVLGRTTNKSINGNISISYAYSGFYLANSEDEVILLDTTGKAVDSFSYSEAKGFTIPTGASLSVRNPNEDKSLPLNWCIEQSLWPGSLGDFGTPGFAPGCH